MIEKKRVFDYISVFANAIQDHIALRESLGFKTVIDSGNLRQFDRYCYNCGYEKLQLTKEIAESWLASTSGNSSPTQMRRVVVLKHFADYLKNKNYTVTWNPPPGYASRKFRTRYVPYIFTHDEMHRIFHTVDEMPSSIYSNFYTVFPTMLRLIYSCGLRVSEALSLGIDDVNWDNGFITIRNTKFDKSRRIPISKTMKAVLIAYASNTKIDTGAEGFFFHTAKNEKFSQRTVYDNFRTILCKSGIPHRGKGYGPRVHDLRHTFAVHSFQRAIDTNKDIYASLPVLSAYLGHVDIHSTEYYLRLTAEIYPDFLERSAKLSDMVIPEVAIYED